MVSTRTGDPDDRSRGATGCDAGKHAEPPRDRAQVFTLEAFLAAILLLGSLLFSLQMTAVTPMSASTSNEHVESQQGRLAAGVLDSAAANGSLRPTLVHWNDTNASFHGAGERGFYRGESPPTAFGRLLERVLGGHDVAYNVNVRYVNREGSLRRQELVRLGSPSDTVGVAVRAVTLYDDDAIRDADGDATDTTVSNASSFYAPDAAPNSTLYNVVRVEVVVWRA